MLKVYNVADGDRVYYGVVTEQKSNTIKVTYQWPNGCTDCHTYRQQANGNWRCTTKFGSLNDDEKEFVFENE